MQPIYKGGNKLKTDPASYRGIYLSSALAKLFEGLLLHRLTQYTEAHDTLTPNQLGTRPGRQTHDAIYSLLAIIQRNWTLGDSYICGVPRLLHSSEKARMQINAQKSKVMAFHETPAQKRKRKERTKKQVQLPSRLTPHPCTSWQPSPPTASAPIF